MKSCDFDYDDEECGKPAVNYIEFSDGSKMWLCAEHYDNWADYIRRGAFDDGDEDFIWICRKNRL